MCRYRSAWLLICLAALPLVGCEQSIKKFEITGMVNYNGKPIPEGDISFTPTGGTSAPPTSAPIKDGKYVVDGRFGIAAGSYKVGVQAYRPKPVDPNDKTEKLAGELNARDQYIPEKFNTKSEIPNVTIDPDGGPVEHDFDLKD